MKAKVSVIGAGNVGATTAHLVVQSGIADVVLFDITEGIPQGKALDLAEAAPLWNVASSITGTNDFSDTRDSDIIVITAGFPRKPGMSRDDLLHANADVIRKVVAGTSALSPGSIYIIVTNPMDVMTQIAWTVSGFDSGRVIGMGGVLDASRFRTFISLELGVSPEDIETLVLGGHGDSMVPLPQYTTVKGVPLKEFLGHERIADLIHRARNGGAEIVALLKTGSAYYAPAASTFQMIKAVLLDEKRLLPCSALLRGEYGHRDVYVGVPVILGKNGVEKIIELPLAKDEALQFDKSAHAVKSMVETASANEQK
ncbi:MAG: malate dehydrogenase [Nitrospirae bacterium]|nr:MAG: malate dehydrogenase [Nitrospirota bacterium]